MDELWTMPRPQTAVKSMGERKAVLDKVTPLQGSGGQVPIQSPTPKTPTVLIQDALGVPQCTVTTHCMDFQHEHIKYEAAVSALGPWDPAVWVSKLLDIGAVWLL